MILITAIITTILAFIISYINTKNINYAQILTSMFGAVFGTFLVLAFMYPIIYKLGVEKARIAIFILVFGIVIIGSLLASYIDLANILKPFAFLEDYLIVILIVITILMIYVSYKISEKIFSKKEF